AQSPDSRSAFGRKQPESDTTRRAGPVRPPTTPRGRVSAALTSLAGSLTLTKVVTTPRRRRASTTSAARGAGAPLSAPAARRAGGLGLGRHRGEHLGHVGVDQLLTGRSGYRYPMVTVADEMPMAHAAVITGRRGVGSAAN